VIVIDASALAAYILREEGYEKIDKYFAEEVVSIELVAKEVLNAVYVAYRRGRINSEHVDIALRSLKELLAKVIRIVSQNDVLKEAFRISLKHNITIYDSLYIALAKRVHGKLLSRDKKQLDIAEGEHIEIIPV